MQKSVKRVLSFILFSFFVLCGSAQAQKLIKGNVKDVHGEPLIGVTVAIKGSTKATVTDIDGNYSLSVPNDTKILTATYVGMKTAEKTISGSSILNFVLEDNNSQLNEVVVIGYGTVKRRDLTGSVASVKGDAVQATPVTNVAEAITGKLAGVQVTTTEGSPDAELSVRVRGGGSITGDNSPLYIVDGFPVASISDIASSDIESIDVLKDASSTAIYGSRGANGVILVTTKSGKEGKLSISYNAYYSWKKNAKKLDVLSTKDYVLWQYELENLRNSKDISSYTDYFGNFQDMDLFDNVPYNDWQDIVFGRTGETFNQSLSLTGGSEKMRYSFNYTHVDDKAIMLGSNYKRDNFSLKLNTNPSKTTKIDLSVRYSDTYIRGGGTNNTNSTYDSDKRLKYTLLYPQIPLNDLLTSSTDDEEFGNLYNPVKSVSENDRKQRRKNLNMTGSFTWEIVKNLKAKVELGVDDNRALDNRFYGMTTYIVRNVYGGYPSIQLQRTDSKSFRSTNTINYDFKKLLKKDHSLTALLGHEYIRTQKNVLTSIVTGFPGSFTAEDAWKFSTEGTAWSTDNNYAPDDILLSWFGRANYDFQSKYLLSATFRADGSSKFGEGNKWGYFPSASAAWRVSSENFMQNTKTWLDDLKIRLSYGTAGNNNIPSGQISQTYSSSTTAWINGFTNYWAPSKIMANPDLKWETTITRNAGLDYSLFGSKLTGSVDFYLNTTKDLLIKFPIPGSGYDYQYRNMGKTQNTGTEFTLNWVAIDNKKVGLSFSGNIAFNKSKIKSLGVMDDFGAYTYWASTDIGVDYWIAKGYSVGKMYGYRSDGRYEVSDFKGYDETSKTWILNDGVADNSGIIGNKRPGAMKLKDLVGNDGIVNEKDKEIIGDANPKNTGGFTINARFHGFDLSAAFNWSYGNDVYNANKIEGTMSGKDSYKYRNMLSDMASGKRWTNLKADGTISNNAVELAAMNANTTMWSPYTTKMIFSDWAVEDGSFLRLNTLTLGYTLPSSLTKKIQLQTARFYVSGYNVFCLTKYSGLDPEVSTIRSTPLTPGVDYSAYPKSRQLVVGVNLNF